MYIYTNSKLEREKRGRNLAMFYEKYLVDGNTLEENEEPLGTGSSKDGNPVRRA